MLALARTCSQEPRPSRSRDGWVAGAEVTEAAGAGCTDPGQGGYPGQPQSGGAERRGSPGVHFGGLGCQVVGWAEGDGAGAEPAGSLHLRAGRVCEEAPADVRGAFEWLGRGVPEDAEDVAGAGAEDAGWPGGRPRPGTARRSPRRCARSARPPARWPRRRRQGPPPVTAAPERKLMSPSGRKPRPSACPILFTHFPSDKARYRGTNRYGFGLVRSGKGRGTRPRSAGDRRRRSVPRRSGGPRWCPHQADGCLDAISMASSRSEQSITS